MSVRHFMYRHPWVIAVIGSLALFGMLGHWALDRSPPFIQKHLDPIAPVRAGEEVVISADVERQHRRGCSASVARELLDANGILHSPFIEKAVLSAESIKAQDKREVNKLRRAFVLPDNLPSGKTVILSHLAYRCAGNPLHAFWPILIDIEWPFQVLPPVPKTVVALPLVIDIKPKDTPEDPVSVIIEPKAKP